MVKLMKSSRWLALGLLLFLAFPVLADSAGGIQRTNVNGMTILLQQTESELAEVTLLLKSGSGLEGTRRGAAELMNNLVYLKLANNQSELGTVRVFTFSDFSVIQIETAAKHLEEVLAEIKGLLSSPLYSYDVIADLKHFYITDLKGISSIARTYQELSREFYGEDHPYNDQLKAEVIAEITGHDVYRWYRRTYQPGNAILSISGGVRQSIGKLEKFFKGLPSEAVDWRQPLQPVVLTENRWLEEEDPNGRISSMAMGFAAPRLNDPEYAAFRIITYYFENYQHYFEELRIKQGLIYSGWVNYNYLEKPKAPMLLFITMTDPEHIITVQDKTVELTAKLAGEGLAPELIGEIAQAIETEGRADLVGGRGVAHRNALSHYFENQLVNDENLWPQLKKVTTDDIKKAATKYLSNYIRVAYVPVEQPDNF